MLIYPRDFFDASELAQTQGTAFVLMPFGETSSLKRRYQRADEATMLQVV